MAELNYCDAHIGMVEKVTGIHSDMKRMSADISDIKCEINKRVPRYLLLIITILSSVCTGLIVKHFG